MQKVVWSLSISKLFIITFKFLQTYPPNHRISWVVWRQHYYVSEEGNKYSKDDKTRHLILNQFRSL